DIAAAKSQMYLLRRNVQKLQFNAFLSICGGSVALKNAPRGKWARLAAARIRLRRIETPTARGFWRVFRA
ncbi:hypothetical protein ABTK18_19430, partial [Acinetobacter baumannii]